MIRSIKNKPSGLFFLSFAKLNDENLILKEILKFMALPYSLTTDKASQIAREVAKDEIAKSGGGTKVIANPMIVGTEDNLTALQVGETKYKIPAGGGNQIIDMWVETDEATENYYLNSHTTYEDISTMLSEGVIPTLHITVDPETYEGPYVIVDGVGVLDNTYAQFSGAHYAADAETGDIVDEHAYSFSLMWATDVAAGSFTVHKFLITSTNEYHVIEYNPNN